MNGSAILPDMPNLQFHDKGVEVRDKMIVKLL
jgi:hypothetical protein